MMEMNSKESSNISLRVHWPDQKSNKLIVASLETKWLVLLMVCNFQIQSDGIRVYRDVNEAVFPSQEYLSLRRLLQGAQIINNTRSNLNKIFKILAEQNEQG